MARNLLKVSIASIALAVSTVTSAASNSGVRLYAKAARLTQGDVVTGPLALTHQLHIVIGLKLQNKADLDAYISTPGFKPLTGTQFVTRYSPTPTQAQAVVNFLRQAGFTHIVISPNRILVSGDAPAVNVQRAFQTTLVSVKTHDGRTAFANASGARLPASLQPFVNGVMGLQNVHIPHLLYGEPIDTVTNAVTGHNPADFPSIYDADDLPPATGVDVGILAEGNLAQTIASLNTFTAQNGYPAVTTRQVGVPNNDVSETHEWELDSQAIIGASGGHVGSLVFYMMPNLTSDTAVAEGINLAVNDNVAKIINGSLGVSEVDAKNDGTFAATDAVLEQGVAQGQTFSFSTGDDGASKCFSLHVNSACWPASSAYVVAVGGTTLDATTGSGATWNNETVWSSAGGAQSTVEARPNWQTVWNGSNRAAPDVVFDADPASGARVIDGSQVLQIGGTSLASPIFAGFWARVIAGKGNPGFAAPLLYKLSSSAFHDITQGSNGNLAGTGYDLASGRGSLILKNVVSDLNSIDSTFVVDISNLGNGKSKLFLMNPETHTFSYWVLSGSTVTSKWSIQVTPGYWVAAVGDFNGDGQVDVMWTSVANDLYLWKGNGTSFVSQYAGTYSASKRVLGAADVTGDGKTDLLFQDDAAHIFSYWAMNGASKTSEYSVSISPGYWVKAVGDLNHDGKADLIWTSALRDLYLWAGNGSGFTPQYIGTYPAGWTLAGAGDVNGDGYSDLLWVNSGSHSFGYWLMQGATILNTWSINTTPGYWISALGDFNSDGKVDVMWTSVSKDLYAWSSNGATFSSQYIGTYPAGLSVLK